MFLKNFPYDKHNRIKIMKLSEFFFTPSPLKDLTLTLKFGSDFVNTSKFVVLVKLVLQANRPCFVIGFPAVCISFFSSFFLFFFYKILIFGRPEFIPALIPYTSLYQYRRYTAMNPITVLVIANPLRVFWSTYSNTLSMFLDKKDLILILSTEVARFVRVLKIL